MIFGIVMLILIYVAYTLFIKGMLWKIILFFAGWWGIFYY